MDQQIQDLRLLFHRLNNQLGIILSHAELLEAKSADSMNRARASQVINSVLDALGTTKELRQAVVDPSAPIVATDPVLQTSDVPQSTKETAGVSALAKPNL